MGEVSETQRTPFTFPLTRRENVALTAREWLGNLGELIAGVGYLAVAGGIVLLALALAGKMPDGGSSTQGAAAWVGWATVCALAGRSLMWVSNQDRLWRYFAGAGAFDRNLRHTSAEDA